MRIATWNLNTWINRKDGISNDQLWQWAEDNLGADIVIFTEAATPPPASIAQHGWTAVHRRGGIPNRSGWGTVIAARNMRIEHVTHVGKDKKYELDTFFPGSFTAADVYVENDYFATVIGLYLPYRKDSAKQFIDHPEQDLRTMNMDFIQLHLDRGADLIVAGDLNSEYDNIPKRLAKLAGGKYELVDPFEDIDMVTYQQSWTTNGFFKMDYLYMSKQLAKKIISKKCGQKDFPTAFDISDHAPLLVELN